ncbi:chlorite dismutase family protein [Acinetobacter baumannii]
MPMEADDLTDLVDMMRDLRYTEARRHVREEVPFYTGRRVTLDEIPEILQ